MKRYSVRVVGDPDSGLSFVMCTVALPSVGSTIQDRVVHSIVPVDADEDPGAPRCAQSRSRFPHGHPAALDAHVWVSPLYDGDSTIDLHDELRVVDILRSRRRAMTR